MTHWIQTNKNVLEVWLVNGAAAVVSMATIQTILSIILMLLTGAYTLWKFRDDYKRSKRNSE